VIRRRGRRLALIAAVALGVVAVTGALASPEIVRRLVVWRLAAATGRPVALAAVELHLLQGRLALRGLRVTDRDGSLLAAIERLEGRFSPRDLLRTHLRVTDALLQAPLLRVVRTGPRTFNVSDLLGAERRGRGPLAVTLERFVLSGGTVLIEDRTLAPPRTWRVEGVAVDARGVSTLEEAPPGIATLHGVAAGSPVSVWVSGVRLSPLRFHATVIAREIDASLAALYLPPGSPLSPTRGRLDASATVEHDPGTGTRIALDAVFGGIELHRPGQESAYLSAPAVRVTVEGLRLRPGAVELERLAVDGGSVVLEDSRLEPVRRWTAEGIALEARQLSSARDAPAGVATLRAVVAGSPLSVWVANLRLAPLELHATAIVRNVDLALLRLYVPPDLPAQPERGIVNASIRIDHDASRGTRLALDAGLGRVEVRRPAHLVTAPALRVTAEDIAFGGGAVTIGHAAVTGDRLELQDRTLTPARTWVVRSLAVEATRLSSRREDVQGVATVRANVDGASVAAWVTHVRLDPLELRATAILRTLDLGLLQLYLPPAAPVQLDRGVVDATVQVDHDRASGTRVTGDVTLAGVQARGRGTAAGLAVAAPTLRVAVAEARRHGQTLGVGRLELTGSGVLTDARVAARLDLERLRLAAEGLTWPILGPARVQASARFLDGGELEASGTALLTAPLPAIAWTTELALKLRAVDIAPAAAYVPAAAGIRGRITADVTATVAYGASLTARVQGDVAGTRLALPEGDRTLLSVLRLEATGLDVVWPERVAVRRIRLERPQALVERDRQGAFPLAARLAAPAVPTEGPRRAGPGIAVDELVVERGSVAFVDARDGQPVRIDIPRVDLGLRQVRWPATAPARLRLEAALPAGGTVGLEGAVGGEPATVDLRLSVASAAIAPFQPYLPFRGAVGGQVDASLAITGPLSPSPRLQARGDAMVRSLAISDGQRPVLTVGRLAAAGIDAVWPGRLALGKVHVQRSWALIQRDREGRFLLRELFQRPPPAGAAGGGPAAPATTALVFSLGEGIFEDGAATIVDAVASPPARLEVTGARLRVRDLTWPARGPVTLELSAPTPGGGRLDARGTMTLDPIRIEARASLDRVALAPSQPYLPIEGRVQGLATGDLAVAVGLDPVSVRITGEVRLQRFRLSDGDRPVVTVGRVDAAGIDVAWPGRLSVQRVLFRRPSLLIERGAEGEIDLYRLVTPRRTGTGRAGPAPRDAVAVGDAPASAARRTRVEIGTLVLERASARFVDQTTRPPFTEQLSDVNVTFTGVTTVPGGRTRFSGSGALGGGATLQFQGQAEAGERPALDVRLDLRDFPVPRVNQYLDRFTAWTATRGTMTASANYTLRGTRLDARHDIVLRQLAVERSDARDEVEKRLGLPLAFLVALLQDARGEIRLSLPVSGDLSTREFDFREAVWSAVRALAIRLLALPFSRIGSLFFSEDSRVEAVTIAPVLFHAGTARPTGAMTAHLDRVAAFLRTTPSVSVRMSPILIQADLDALKRERVTARLAGRPGSAGGDLLEAARREYRERWPDRQPPATLEAMVGELAAAEEIPAEAPRDLGARRLEVVRHELAARGIDPVRLTGSARRVPLVEAAGTARVELDLRP
jgi:hypothetical protein